MSRRTHADRGATESFSALLPDEVEDLAASVLERAKQRELSIATAESCTGGMLASVLTDLAAAATGYADDGDEPGLVHFAVAVEGASTRHREERFGPIGRGPVRVESIRVALTMMDEAL